MEGQKEKKYHSQLLRILFHQILGYYHQFSVVTVYQYLLYCFFEWIYAYGFLSLYEVFNFSGYHVYSAHDKSS